MKCVLMDVDGVIADFSQAYVNCARKVIDRELGDVDFLLRTDWDIGDALKLTVKEKDKVHSLFDWPGFGLTLKPLSGSIEGVRRIAEISDLYFVTAPYETNPTWCYDRRKWLCDKFGDELGKKVIYTKYKYLVAGDLLVDDRTENVADWFKAMKRLNISAKGIVWAYGFNQKAPYPRTNDWDLLYKWVVDA